MGKVTVEMSGDEAKLFRAWERIISQQNKAEEGQKKLGRTAGKTGKKMEQEANRAKRAWNKTQTSQLQMAKKVITGIAGAAGLGSVAGAVGIAREAYQNWIADIHDVSAEATKASKSMIAFAALQSGGKKAERVQLAADMAAKHGISDLGQAWSTVQAMQSARGDDFDAGMKGAATIFKATQLGMGLEDATELSVMGASQGQKPGAALRRAYVAGQLSSRDPAALAKAAAGGKFFDNKDFAFASAAVLAGDMPVAQLATYYKQAGMGLAETGPAQKSFEKLGLGQASRKEKLRALHERGLVTDPQLKKFGFSEQRQREAIMGLAKNFPAVEKYEKAIRARAVPGLFPSQQAAVEAELPGIRVARQMDETQAEIVKEMAIGPDAVPAQKRVLKESKLALAFNKRGLRQSAGYLFNLVDKNESGQRVSDEWDIGQAVVADAIMGGLWKTPTKKGLPHQLSTALNNSDANAPSAATAATDGLLLGMGISLPDQMLGELKQTNELLRGQGRQQSEQSRQQNNPTLGRPDQDKPRNG